MPSPLAARSLPADSTASTATEAREEPEDGSWWGGGIDPTVSDYPTTSSDYPTTSSDYPTTSSDSGTAPAPGSEDDPETHVVFPLDVYSNWAMKMVFRLVYGFAVVSFAALATLFAVKTTDKMVALSKTRPLNLVNTVVACLHLSTLGTILALFGRRIAAVRAAGLKWTNRRRWTALRVGLRLLFAILVNIFYLLANARAIGRECLLPDRLLNAYGCLRYTFLSGIYALYVVTARGFVPWVDKDGGPVEDYNAVLADAGWRGNWFIAVYWLVFQATNVAMASYLQERFSGEDCDAEIRTCKAEAVDVAYGIVLTVGFNGYVLMYLYYVRLAFVELGKKQYVPFRWTNIELRYDFRTTGLAFLLLMISNVLLWLVEIDSCASFAMAAYGFLPAVAVLTGFTAVDSVMVLPVRPGAKVTVRLSQDKLLWTEEQRDSKSVTDANEDSTPAFCFETAVKLYYWCEVVYEYDDATGSANPPFSLDVALDLYGLENAEYLKEEALDSNALLAWNRRTIVLSFRGSYSATNLCADLKLWRAVHPPKRGNYWLGTMPMAHKGFLQSWTSRGFNERVLAAVKRVMLSPGFDVDRMRVLVTGHSLGGAVAQLAACDIRRHCGVASDRVTVYTFGCPRVGNHAFAREYEAAVPDTWHVVNDLDAVARTPKFWVLYKRAGKRMVINPKGDGILDPLFMEFKMMSLYVAKVKVTDHWLSAYRKSLRAVVCAQFIKWKGIPGGKRAMQRLFDKGVISAVLALRASTASRLAARGSGVWSPRRPEEPTPGTDAAAAPFQSAKVLLASAWSCWAGLYPASPPRLSFEASKSASGRGGDIEEARPAAA